MKIERKNLKNSVVELIVEEDTKNIAKLRKQVLKEVAENADIKGFRKWANIPEDVIVRNFWEEKIAQMTIEKAIDSMYRKALTKEKLVPVAQWEIKEIISENPLKIKIEIEVLPEVKIEKKYKDISLAKTKVSVNASEVKAALEDIEKRFTKFVETDDKKYKLKMWDRATIDTQGFDSKKKELENTNMKDYPLVLGSNILVPGFEEKMVWAKILGELDLDIEFPKDYHNKDFAGKKTIFKVNIKKIEKAEKPEFTPEFIEQLRGKKLDLDWFKALIKEEIKETKESNARLEDEQKLIKELLKVSKVELWEKLLSHQVDKVFEEIKENMTNQGVKMKDYLESLKLDEKTYKENHVKETAVLRLQWELLLAELLKLEKIEVDDKEIKTEIDTIISKYGSEDVKKRLEELYIPWTKYYEELKQRIMYRKIIDSFFTKK